MIDNKLFKPSGTLMGSFLHELQNMQMAYSYKPVLMLAILENANRFGRVAVSDVVDYFLHFYSKRKAEGLIVEQENSVIVQNLHDFHKVQRTILINPVAAFVNKRFLFYDEKSETIFFAPLIWNAMTREFRMFTKKCCEEALEKYYQRFKLN